MLAEIARETETEIPAALADRISRIAWLAAHSHGVRLDEVIRRTPARPAAMRARNLAIAVTSELLKLPPATLARYFRDEEAGIDEACRAVAERAARERGTCTTLNFLRSSCAAVLGPEQ